MAGFPVVVRPGFFMFMALVVFVQGWQFGVPFAGFMAVFTLLHELGHAIAARRTGASALISLEFMAGYAAYQPSRELTKGERALIAFAGPAVQIVVGTAVYIAARGAFAWPQAGKPVEFAVLWAGPVIGLLNLLPLLPFDGGNIALVAVEVFAPHRARRIVTVFTIVVSLAAFVGTSTSPTLQPFTIFALIPLFAAAASMRADRGTTQRSTRSSNLQRSEALAWVTGTIDFRPGTAPSPWFRAWQQLSAGHPDVARQVILDDLQNEPTLEWTSPDTAPPDALRQLLALLPRPLPTGRPYATYVLGDVLLRTGDHADAATVAAAGFNAHRAPVLAVQVARAAAALGDRATCIGWLRAAVAVAPAGTSMVGMLDAPEFETLRHDPDVRAAAGQSTSSVLGT